MKTFNNQNTCSCCEGISVEVPVKIYNRPGLDNISYRIGNHPRFKAGLMARLTQSGQNILKKITTRENNDFTIALADAWAMVADVLTFYQERISNESFLATATERHSILEMARLLGYQLNPGVAASVFIAFTLEDTPGALTPGENSENGEPMRPITLKSGTKIQSIPGPDEKAQTFETIEDFEARPGWNALKPRLYQPQSISANKDLFYLQGINTGCNKGDIILILDNGTITLKKIVEVIPDPEKDTTCIKFGENATVDPYNPPEPSKQGKIKDYRDITTLDQSVVEDILIDKVWYDNELSVLLSLKNWSEREFIKSAEKHLSKNETGENKVFIYRKQAFVFGYNAMKIAFDGSSQAPLAQNNWTEWDLNETKGNIYLDDAYKEILPESFISIQNDKDKLKEVNTYEIKSAEIKSRTEYGISAKTTHVTFAPEEEWWNPAAPGKDDELSQIRGTKVYAQSEELELTQIPITKEVHGEEITLNGLYPGLEKGQKVIIHGAIKDPEGVVSSELKELKQVTIENGYTVIQFKTSLKHQYIRDKLVIHANVALASHGETVEEILGGGVPGKMFQKFTLSHTPLTYTSATNSKGSKSTLEIRVNDVLWEEVETFYGHGPDDRIYVIQIDNQGNTTIIFGDGITGARLPGGQDNVRAKYRKGIGLAGMLKKDQLSQLMTKPLGVKSASNPIPSSGAADPEHLANAKKNAPLSILTLDRIVSLQDYEDFTRAFAGIEKSLATWSWKSGKRWVYLTIAGPGGAVIEKDSTVYKNLKDALKNSGNPNTPVIVESYRPRYFVLSAKIKPNPELEGEKVISIANAKLREKFSFGNRQFGQPVVYSEIVSAIHEIKGVMAVDVDSLYFSDEAESFNQALRASIPEAGDEETKAAELLTLDPRPVNLQLMV